MRRNRSVGSWVGGAMLAAAANAAAQDPEVATRAQVAASASNALNAKDSDEEQLSVDKMFDQAKLFMKKMRDVVERGERRKKEAKDQKDVIKLNFITERLSRAVSILQDAEHTMAALSDAVVRNDTQEIRHEFQRIRILYQRVLVLAVEMDNATGEDDSRVGPTAIEVEVDPTIPQGDPTDIGLPTPNFTMPPPGVEDAVVDSPFEVAADPGAKG